MKVTEFNVGQWCKSEDECIAAGINFADYERGVSDAAEAFARNRQATSAEQDERLYAILRGTGYVTRGQALEMVELLRAASVVPGEEQR